ncbi:hypothetical protein DWV16_11855 [Anaerotruncus sp. AF02-27]|uniref:hypothetical protein n=1 Tax=Anaerotruncus TaxID=244127 RepID=UPI000E4BD410|nr:MULTISPECIES: hypothetical protein [Anaerotruncus]RGX54912.1 hypothetical protein DWV16_11855 [Anaerotruncus sp. AF02-27]
MTRSSSRILSLALAFLFLLFSAGISFAAVLLGIPVQAADLPRVDSVEADGEDITKVALSNGKIDSLVIKLRQAAGTAVPDPTGEVTVEFTTDNFQLSSDSDKVISEVNTGEDITYTLTITNVNYTEKKTGKMSFKLTYHIDGNPSKTESVDFTFDNILTNSTEGNYSISSATFYNSSGRPISKVTKGSYNSFRVTIRDTNLSKSEFQAIKDNVTFNINSDFIRNFTSSEIIEVKGSDVVSYTIEFKGPYYTGDTNRMILDVDYHDSYYATRHFNEIIDGCEIYERDKDDDDDDDDDDSSSKPDIAPPTPNIIVSEFDYGSGSVTAASNFDLKITFTNTSQKLPVDNIVLKVTVPEAFTMNGSSNTFYIDKLSKNSSVQRTLHLSVKPNAEPISHPIKLSFAFESVIEEARKQFTSEEEISIPVSQLDRFSLEPVEVPNEVYVGEDSGIEATFINKGKTTVYNVTAEITGNISQPGQRQFIGNIEGGKEESADFLIGALEAGPISGEVIITYEDANMNVGELRSPFTTNGIMIEMPPMDQEMINPEDMPPEESPAWYAQIPIWAYMVGGVVLIIVLAFIAKVIRNRREQKLLEDDDEDI